MSRTPKILNANAISCFFVSECCSKREMPSLYPHAKGILYALKDKGIDVAIASRSPTVDIAKAFLDKLDISLMFVAQVSYCECSGFCLIALLILKLLD